MPTPAWVITGPTSGFGHATALELAKHGTVVLVGRNANKLTAVKTEIEKSGGAATTVVGDLSDIASARHAAAEVAALDLPLRGVLNNAGVMLSTPATSPQGWEVSFATNHLGPLAFTETLIPTLADGTNVVFITSAAEDPERIPAVRAGFRGGRYIDAEAAAHGKYTPGGSSRAGMDAYATSKQGNLAAVFSLARQYPALRFRAIEPGVNPGSNLGELAAPLRLLARALTPALTVFPHFTTSKRAARVITTILTDTSAATGLYYDENGNTMKASKQVSDLDFSNRFISESRDLLATVPS